METIRIISSAIRKRTTRYIRKTKRSLRWSGVHPAITNRETEPYKAAIQLLGVHHLSPESITDTVEKIEGIAKMGHLCWTGGTEAAEYAGRNFLFPLVSLLAEKSSSHELKLQIIKSLGELCCGIKHNQDMARELSVISIIIDHMAATEEDAETDCVLLGLDDDWEAWEHNEAEELDIMTSVVK